MRTSITHKHRHPHPHPRPINHFSRHTQALICSFTRVSKIRPCVYTHIHTHKSTENSMSSEPLLSPYGGEHEIGENCSFNFPSPEGGFLLPQMSVVRKRELTAAGSGTWRQTWIVKWGQRKVVDPFMVILQRGLEPKLLSLSAAVGITIGLFPVCGITMILCALAAVTLRSNCHVPTLMLGNLVASIFELGLLIPLMRVGEVVTGGEHFSISSSGLWEAIRGREPPHALVFGMLHAVIGWSIFAPFSVAILYIGFLPIFKYLTAKFGANKLLLHQISGTQQAIDSSSCGSLNNV